MVTRLTAYLLLAVMAAGAAAPPKKPKGEGTLPDELLQIAKELGCGPVPGFYDRPGMVDPPYLYGWLPRDKEETAAFWCHRDDENKPYLLVFVEGLGSGQEGSVTSTLAWSDYPGGLSLFDIENVVGWYDSEGARLTNSERLPLSEFYYVDTRKPGPKGRTTEYRPLQESYDGIITLYYRDGDRWLFVSFD